MTFRLVASALTRSPWLLGVALTTAAMAVTTGAAAEEPKVADTAAAAAASAPEQPAATKESLKEASEHYDLGLKMYQSAEYALAVIEFERAYSLVSDYRVLYNIGQVRIQLGNYARARRALEQYLRDGGSNIPTDRRASVQNDLDMLAARTATLDVKTNAAGADILVDDTPVGQAPLSEPLLLDAGEHHVTVQKAGYQSRSAQLTLAGRDTGNLELNLEKIPEAGGQRVIVEKVAAPESSDRETWIWATWATAGVLAIGSGVTEALGAKAAGDLDDLRNDPTATRGELDSSSRRARTLLTVGDVLGGLAIATGGVALYLTLSGPSEQEKSPATKTASKARVSCVLRPGFVGLAGAY